MRQKQEKLETKMKWMLLSTMIPMAILIIVLLVFFWHYTNEYNQLSNNLAVSTEYNANYKNSTSDMRETEKNYDKKGKPAFSEVSDELSDKSSETDE